MSCVLFDDRDLIEAKDEKVISHYLKTIIKNGPGIWANPYVADADVFNKNPKDLQVFISKNPIFVFVKPKTESCGKTDGCESGCWRIMGRDKLIKCQESGKILGFKKILRFREKTKPREYKRSWVMEEYRLSKKWNWRQDQVICKIRVVFDNEISSLLAKHFSCLHTRPRSSSHRRLPHAEAERSFQGYGLFLTDEEQEKEDATFLQIINNSSGNHWPVIYHLTNEVYRVHPYSLFDLRDPRSVAYGISIFVNRIDETYGKTDGCELGRWRIVRRDRLIKSPTTTGKVLGLKRVYVFLESQERRYVINGQEVNMTWTMEEYRLATKAKKEKVLCYVKLCFPDALERLLRRNL